MYVSDVTEAVSETVAESIGTRFTLLLTAGVISKSGVKGETETEATVAVTVGAVGLKMSYTERTGIAGLGPLDTLGCFDLSALIGAIQTSL